MGSQLIKGYTIKDNINIQISPYKRWKLYQAQKEGNKNIVSVFLLQKKNINLKNREQQLKQLRKQIKNLSKVRHPNILSLLEPPIDDDNNLIYITENVQASLYSLIKYKQNYKIAKSQLQLRLHLINLLQAIKFLHNTVKNVHLSLNLENIFLDSEGQWKLAGLGTLQLLTIDKTQELKINLQNYAYCAPEVMQGKFSAKSDIYSIGILIIHLLKAIKGKLKIEECMMNKDQYSNKNNELLFDRIIKQSQNAQKLQKLLNRILLQKQQNRINIQDLIQHEWINDKYIKTIRCLNQLTNYQKQKQIEFLKNFITILIDFKQEQILILKIIQQLINLLKFQYLISYIIYILLDIIKNQYITKKIFHLKIWIQFKYITKMKTINAQTLFILINNYQNLELYITQNDIIQYIFPLYLKCFDCHSKLKQLAFKKSLYICKKIDYQIVKTKIVPKITSLVKDNDIQVRKNALKTIYNIIPILDTQIIITNILNGLENARKGSSDPFISAITVKIYSDLTKKLSLDLIITKILPSILPYLLNPQISSNQFMAYKKIINESIENLNQSRDKTCRNKPQENLYTTEDFIFKDQIKTTVQKAKPNYDFLEKYTLFRKIQSNEQQNWSYGQNQPLQQNIILHDNNDHSVRKQIPSFEIKNNPIIAVKPIEQTINPPKKQINNLVKQQQQKKKLIGPIKPPKKVQVIEYNSNQDNKNITLDYNKININETKNEIKINEQIVKYLDDPFASIQQQYRKQRENNNNIIIQQSNKNTSINFDLL